MNVLRIGLVGGIGQGKDLCAGVITEVLNGIARGASGQINYDAAYHCKMSQVLKDAFALTGMEDTREAKEVATKVRSGEIFSSLRFAAGKVAQATGLAEESVFTQLSAVFSKTYGVWGYPYFQLSPRQYQVLLGEFCRDAYGPDIWLRMALSNELTAPFQVYSDIRYRNEAAAMDVLVMVHGDRYNPDEWGHVASQQFTHKLLADPTFAEEEGVAAYIENNKDTLLHFVIKQAAEVAVACYGLLTHMNSTEA